MNAGKVNGQGTNFPALIIGRLGITFLFLFVLSPPTNKNKDTENWW